jgi:hypothetical protein
MNLQGIKDYISANPKTLFIEDLPDQDYGTYLFVRVTYKIDDVTADQMAVCILIKNRGEANEEAYIKGTIPAYMKATPFKDALITTIENIQATLPELEAYEILKCDELTKVSTCIGYYFDSVSGKSIPKSYVAFDDGTSIIFRELTTPAQT